MSCVRQSTWAIGTILLSIKYFHDISKKFHPISDETAHMKIFKFDTRELQQTNKNEASLLSEKTYKKE